MGRDRRYVVQKRLGEVGEAGQEKLRKATVLVVGCGALGSPASVYLAGAGVGRIILADYDNIELTNLHRQVFYREEEIGLSKVEALQQRLNELNSDIETIAVKQLVTPALLQTEVLNEVDVIIDAADNPATTYMLDNYCKEKGIALVTAGISEWKAQIFTYLPGSAAYSDYFPRPSEESGVLPCSVAGVAGSVASFAASLQTTQTLKILLGIAGKSSSLILANLLTDEITTLRP